MIPERLTHPNFKAVHGFFTRCGGTSQGIYASLNCGFGSQDMPQTITANRARVTQTIGAQILITPYQTHSTKVAIIDTITQASPAPRADALITKRRGIALGVLTADCVPILFAAHTPQIIGITHAGWRGAYNGIIAATITAMRNQGARHIHALIGPSISYDAYEVEDKFAANIIAKYPHDQNLFTPAHRKQHQQFNLIDFVCHQLHRAAVAKIDHCRACTYQNPDRFFSYRRATHQNQPDYGRQISVISLTR